HHEMATLLRNPQQENPTPPSTHFSPPPATTGVPGGPHRAGHDHGIPGPDGFSERGPIHHAGTRRQLLGGGPTRGARHGRPGQFHALRVVHSILRAERPGGHHARAGRQFVVHRQLPRQQHRPHHDRRRRDHFYHPHRPGGALPHHGRAGRQPVVHRVGRQQHR